MLNSKIVRVMDTGMCLECRLCLCVVRDARANTGKAECFRGDCDNHLGQRKVSLHLLPPYTGEEPLPPGTQE